MVKALNYSDAFVLGSEDYYPRFGYRPAEEFGIEVPQGWPSKNFMAFPLKNKSKAIQGKVTYAKEFGL